MHELIACVNIHELADFTLHGVVRYAHPQRALAPYAREAMHDMDVLQQLRLLEQRDDGARLFSFQIVATEALRGIWVAVVPASARSASELLRLCRFEGEKESCAWIHNDDPTRTSSLERARWLALACGTNLAQLRLAAVHCEDAWVHLKLGRALVDEAQFEEALACFARCAKEARDGHATDRARALLGLERADEALRVLDEVPLGAHASEARAAWARGLVLIALGRAKEAVQSLKNALVASDETWPQRLQVVSYALAHAAFNAGLFEDALVGCADLYSADSRMLHGRSLEALARFTEARIEYEKARALGSSEAPLALLAVDKRIAAASPKHALGATTMIDLGMRVTHAKLGEGEVLDVEDGNPPRVLVAFESGEKWVLASTVRAL